ncbi:hypothetical protein [Bartonella apis]|uniref:hypothetical protein n=1 Tax=Bartonella apis TaxID=1686310 RepID=UPI003BB5C703
MKRTEEIKPLLSGMIRSFPFSPVKNRGFACRKFATRQLIEPVTIWLSKNRQAEKQSGNRLFKV